MKNVLVTGKGRSGTTWLAQILNTYVHCSYKHEPFLPSKRTPWLEIRENLERESIEQLRARYARVSTWAIHGVDQPPFPDKSVHRQNPRVMRALYALGNRVPPAKKLFEVYARPHMHEGADVLMKEVNFPNELLPKLCEVLQPWLVPIVRNPFANIASYLKGVELGYFGEVKPEDKARVRELIAAPGGERLRRWADRLDELSVLQFETLRWRLQVEPLIAFSETYEPSKLVVYEDLCADPIGKTEELFDFLGWKVHATTPEFIAASTSGARKERDTEHAYYTVYRDPRRSMNKWRSQLPFALQEEIASVFRESPYKGLWRDLPL